MFIKNPTCMTVDITQVVNHLPSKCEAVSSNPRTVKEEGRGEKERKEGRKEEKAERKREMKGGKKERKCFLQSW
jgi:hypothetical protein